MPVSVHQPMRELVHQFERALDRRCRLQRVQIGEAFEARRALVQARIVLHRARAEREETEIDGVVLLDKRTKWRIVSGSEKPGNSSAALRPKPPASRTCRPSAQADRRPCRSRGPFRKSAARPVAGRLIAGCGFVDHASTFFSASA
jgi:hypothetical protein